MVAVRAHALAHAGVPPGFDGGDWLAVGHGLVGRNVRPSGVVVAPLAPLLTLAAATVLGRTIAFVSLGAALSALPAAGVYIVLRTLVDRFDAVVLSSLLLVVAGSGEAASWGGYPQLLGLGLLPVAAFAAGRAFGGDGRRWSIVGGALLLAIALTSDLVLAVALPTVVMIVIATSARRLLEPDGRAALRAPLAWMFAPLVLVMPLYAGLGRARADAVTHPAKLLGSAHPNLLSRVDAVWADSRTLWHVVAIVGLVAIPLSWSRRETPLWRLSVALLAPAVVLVLVFPEPRLAYFLPTAIVMSAALWSEEWRALAPAPVVSLIMVAALAIQTGPLPATARKQAARYQALTPGLVAGIDWLRHETKRSAVVVVTPYRDAPPLGWWIEGLAQRRTLSASSPEWVYFESERVNAARAARVLSAGVPTVATLDIARQYGADYVFLDKRWADYVPNRIRSVAEVHARVAFENREVVILRTRAAPSGVAR